MVAPNRCCLSTHTITVVKHKNTTSLRSCQGGSSPRPAPRQDSYGKISFRMSGRTPRGCVVHLVVHTTSHSDELSDKDYVEWRKTGTGGRMNIRARSCSTPGELHGWHLTVGGNMGCNAAENGALSRVWYGRIYKRSHSRSPKGRCYESMRMVIPLRAGGTISPVSPIALFSEGTEQQLTLANGP
jgi:hypothetical protein